MRLGTIEDAVQALHAGGLACFPTETLWSLSCNARSEAAVAHLRQAKQRPVTQPLAVGFLSWNASRLYIKPTVGASRVADALLPGPVSLVVERADEELSHVAPADKTLSIRVPSHPIAQGVLGAAGPLIMTSANAHGEPDPVSADDVLEAMHGIDGIVVDADDVPGTASTIVDCTGAEPVILRPGAIDADAIAAAWSGAPTVM